MTPEHFEKTLRAFQRRKPFRVYTVELVSGDRVRVDRPEALIQRDGVAVFISVDGTPTLFDYEGVTHILDEPTPQATPAD